MLTHAALQACVNSREIFSDETVCTNHTCGSTTLKPAVATYRKRNLVRTKPEHYVFEAGTWLLVVKAGGVRVSLVVCWDLGFPEVAREAALGGADFILAPAAWREPWGPQYELSCAARALDSGVYVASANQIGAYPEARFDTPGHLYGPDGLRV